MKTQDPKYDIEDGKLVNAATRTPIPEDEPVFILRAKDKNAALAIAYYKRLCDNTDHEESVDVRLHEFVDFAMDFPDQMKEPDTARRA